MSRKIISLSKIRCRVCKNWFTPNAKTTVICSNTCRVINRREWEENNNRIKREKRLEKVKKIKCRNCRKKFLPATCARVFCSKNCALAFNIYKKKKPNQSLKKHRYRDYKISAALNTSKQKELHRLELKKAVGKFLKNGGEIERLPPMPLPQIPSVGSRDWPWEYMIGLGYYGMEELTEPEVNIEDLIKK
jgi:hypothetical protein